MKRLIVLILCLALAMPAIALATEVTDVPAPDPVIVPDPVVVIPVNAVVPDFSRLVVGSTTPMTGEFFLSLWGNNTADIDVRLLLHDAATVAWQDEGAYGGNENILEQMETTVNTANGDHIFTFTLRDGLKYSDGSPITAKDYVFSALLQSSDELAGLGVALSAYDALRGYQQFSSGESDVFTGVRLLNDLSFSLTINGNYLPYFYELSLVNVSPYPIDVLAPGCDVRDDGDGAYIEGELTTALLEKTICDPATGYRFHPTVTSGPYTLVSYDAAERVAEFELNPYYAGNYQGQKPVIERIVYRSVRNDDVMSLLHTGEINLMNKVSSGSVINDGLTGVGIGEYSMAYYLRAGLSFFAFKCDEGLTSSLEVRQALMHCIDQQSMIDGFLLGYGQKVYGMYGYGQWMVSTQTEALEALNVYPFDTAAAAGLFDQAGFRYNAQGGAYESGVRYNKDGAALSFRLAKTADNAAADEAEALLRDAFAVVGAELVTDTLSSADMLAMYYRQIENPYDLMFMASNFTFTFDPYYAYHTDPAFAKLYNTSGLIDEKLMNLARAMRETEPEDTEGYAEKWLEFQTYWVSVAPFLPLYSNIYFDFYSPYLENFPIASYSSWAPAIVYANFDDVIEPEEEIPVGGEGEEIIP